eukprot:12349498-Prorocentrum_lima.AAC.1
MGKEICAVRPLPGVCLLSLQQPRGGGGPDPGARGAVQDGPITRTPGGGGQRARDSATGRRRRCWCVLPLR